MTTETRELSRLSQGAASGLLKRFFGPALAIFCISSLCCLAIDYRLRSLAADDSFIHLRIARHLAQTGHAFFNIHERVMATSSPVWTLALALSSSLFGSLPASLPLECLGMGFACMLSFLLAVQLRPSLQQPTWLRYLYLLSLPALVFLSLLQSAISQMETPLAVALMLGGVYFFERSRISWLAFFVLAAFTRYEYFPLGLCFFGIALVQRRITVKAAAIGFVTLGAAVCLLFLQYGTVIPNSVRAKAAGYIVPFEATLGSLGLGLGKPVILARSVLLIIAVLAVVTGASARRFATPSVLLLFGAGLDVLYVLKHTLIFAWYLPLSFVPIVIGLMLGLASSPKVWERSLALATVLLFAFMPLRVAIPELLAAAIGQPWRDSPDAFNIRVVEYRTVGRALEGSCPAGRLMTSEIGGLGDGFKGEILDGFGLASPAAIKYHPMRVPEERSSALLGAIPLGFVQETHPDVIVSYQSFAESVLKNFDPSMYVHYEYPGLPSEEMAQFKWTNSRLHILAAKSGTCSPGSIDRAVSSSLLGISSAGSAATTRQP